MIDLESKSIVLGITGGIGCGKSEVGRFLEQIGFDVVDADHVAHELMQPGKAAYKEVVEHFGQRIVSESGEISRQILGEIIFSDPSQRAILNQIIHPIVRQVLADWISKKRFRSSPAALLIPLLFECKLEQLDLDAVICVSASHDLMIQRLEGRGLRLEEAEQRISSQMPLSVKEKRADLVVPNNGTLAELEWATCNAVKALLKGEHERRKQSC